MGCPPPPGAPPPLQPPKLLKSPRGHTLTGGRPRGVGTLDICPFWLVCGRVLQFLYFFQHPHRKAERAVQDGHSPFISRF